MGSGAGAVAECVDALVARGERVGMVTVRLYRPFPAEALMRALPPSCTRIAVLDRTKEPGAVGEPLYLDVRAAIDEAMEDDEPPFAVAPRVIGGRYGLSSKDFTPAMVAAVFAELDATEPRREFTVGIVDDVTHLSLAPVEIDIARSPSEVQALFFGLGSDGTVGANKSSVKIIGEGTDLFAQGYFVYDSKKSGSVTVSHLRFGPEPIRSTYLIDGADFVACHQFGLLDKMKVLELARPGATFLLNSPFGPDEVWDHLPVEVQDQIVTKDIALWVVDAEAIARAAGMGNRINTVMQPCFFSLSGVLPADEAVERIKASVAKAYAKRGQSVVDHNFAAIDASLAGLARVPVPAAVSATRHRPPPVPADRTRLRPAGHRGDARRRRRPAPGLGDAARRHLPLGYRQVREAGHRRRDPDLGPRRLHRLRQVRHRLPPRRHPHEGVRAVGARRSSRRLRVQGLPVEGPRRPPAHHPGGTGRLHRLRCLRRRLPGQVEVRGPPQGHQHGAGRRPP